MKRGEIHWKYTDIYFYMEENNKFTEILHIFTVFEKMGNVTDIFI